MNKSNRFSPEVRERAVRMVQEHRGEYPSLWAAIESIAPKIGCVPQTLHEWVRKHEIDTGMRDGITSEERDSRLVRGLGPFLFTDCRAGQGLTAVISRLEAARLVGVDAPARHRHRSGDDGHGHVHELAGMGRINRGAPSA